MLNIALFGPPGAGKGTQSEFLIEKYKLFYISTEDLLRKEIAEGSALGLEALSIIASGVLVSDEIIVQIMQKTIQSQCQRISLRWFSANLYSGLYFRRVDD